MSKALIKPFVFENTLRRQYLSFQLSKNFHQATSASNRASNEQVSQFISLSVVLRVLCQIRNRRSELFQSEKKRQLNMIPRLEKIEVQYQGVPEDATLIMNKNISTPYNIAQHLTEMLCDRSALALVNGQIWDMHRLN